MIDKIFWSRMGYSSWYEQDIIARAKMQHYDIKLIAPTGVVKGRNVGLYHKAPYVMEHILSLFEAGIAPARILKFYDPKVACMYSDVKSDCIRDCLIAGKDPSLLLGSGLNDEQIVTLAYAILRGCDVTPYANPKMHPDVMRVYSKAQIDGVFSKFAKVSFAKLKIPNNSRGARIMRIIEDAMVQGIDIVPYITDLDEDKIRMLPESLTNGTYGHTYDAEQTKQINLGRRKGLTPQEIKIYSDPAYSAAQMREIRLGLQQGVDVTQYLDRKISASKMGEIRLCLPRTAAQAVVKQEEEGESSPVQPISAGLERVA